MRLRLTKFSLYLLLFLCMAAIPAGAVPVSNSATISAPTVAQWDSLTNQKEFSYRNEREMADVKPQEQSSNWFFRWIELILKFLFSGFGRLLLWVIIFAILAFALYKIFLSDKTFIFGRRKKVYSAEDPKEIKEDDLSGADWQQRLQDAISRQDTRQAIRYSYMLLLQTLQDKQLIEYRQDKTNFDYSRELSATIYKQPFRQLTRQYEYTWYGHFILQQPEFESYMQSFQLMLNQLKKK